MEESQKECANSETIDGNEPRLIYQALPSARSFRLIELLPGDWGDPIHFNLLIDNLDLLFNAYEAVSYAWGDSSDRGAVRCNGITASITKSLFSALRAFRKLPEEGPRILWADDVCIDQSNVTERNTQVQLMQHIYRRAGKVLIWLGDSDAVDVQRGLNLVCQIATKSIAEQENEHPSQTGTNHKDDPEAYYMWRDNHSSAPYPISFLDTELEVTSLRPLCALFERKWFFRLWVIQELVLSTAAEVHWGEGSIDFMLIGQAATYVLDHHKSGFVQYEAFDGLKKCYTIFGIWTNRWTVLSFFDMLWLSRGFEASDPRDKIFGMLGLTTSDSKPDAAPFMEPDYSLSASEVYTHVATKILVDQHEVDLLATVQHGRRMRTDWISWVPDWSSRYTNYLCNSDRKTCGEVRSRIERVASSDKSTHLVSVQGIIVDTIANLVGVDFDDSLRWWNADVAEALETLIRQVEPTFGAETTAHTLTAGLGSDGYVVVDTATFMNEYAAFKDGDSATYATPMSPVSDGVSAQADHQVQAGYRFFANSGPTMLQRRCFKTLSQMLGLGPLAMAAGDIVAVLFGGTVPYVLRPTTNPQQYRLVGECYVHDVMNGEAVAKWQESGQAAVDFHLY